MEKNSHRFNTKIKYYDSENVQMTVCQKSVFGWTVTDEEYNNVKLEAYKKRRAEQLAACSASGAVQNDEAEAATSAEVRDRTDNLVRAKRKVYDIAYANGGEWSYMVTLTLDGSKVDRYSPEAVLKPFQNWLKNCVKRKGLKALIVPELHSDGAIHFHGLFNNALKVSDSGTVKAEGYKKPIKRSTAKKYGLDTAKLKPVYNCDDWKNGFSTFVPLDDNTAAVCHYITKYITKDFEKIFGKYYFCVGDLKREVPTYFTNTDPEEMTYSGDTRDLGIKTRTSPEGFATFYYFKGTLEEVTALVNATN